MCDSIELSLHEVTLYLVSQFGPFRLAPVYLHFDVCILLRLDYQLLSTF